MNSKNPKFPTVKAVYCWDSSAIFTCQNPLLKSIIEKWADPAMLSNASCIHSSGYESFFVCALSQWKSMQKHSAPSFFCTNMTVLHHGTGWGISLLHATYHRVRHGPPPVVGGIHLKHSLNGSLSVIQILCSTALMPLQCEHIMETQHQLPCCSRIMGSPVAEPAQVQLVH